MLFYMINIMHYAFLKGRKAQTADLKTKKLLEVTAFYFGAQASYPDMAAECAGLIEATLENILYIHVTKGSWGSFSV